MPRCDHCLLEFPDREAVHDTIDGQEKVFCCNGCSGIYHLIHQEGLDAFYEKRKWNESGISSALFHREPDIKSFAEHVTESGNDREIDLYIEGIRCASCVWLNEKILLKSEGVEYARVNYATHRARIRWDPNRTGLERILKRILSVGYIPKPFSESEQLKVQQAETKDLLVRLGTAGFLSSQLMIYSIALYAGYFQGIDPGTKRILEVIAMLLTVPVLFYSGMPFIRNTINGFRHLHFTMDSLIIIGAGSAFIYSIYEIFAGGEVYFDTSAMIITLILLGRYIEAAAKGKASETVKRLLELSPKTAVKLVRNQETGTDERETVLLTSLSKGDLVEVKPGEKIPLDGTVIAGESENDESLLTGESRPVPKIPGNEAIGGSMNLFGTLTIEVTRTGKDTVLAGIIKAVEDAQAHKPRIQALADRVVGIFVPAILVIALVTVVSYLARGSSLHHSLMTGVSVLVIACPCSLGLATPLAVLIFTTMASSRGILIRNSEVVENAARLGHIIFDKTGTITKGRSLLKEVIIADQSLAREHLLSVAASVECLSEHSIGHAICGAAIPSFPVTGFKAFPGKGVEGHVEGRRILIGNRVLMQEQGINMTALGRLDESAGDFEGQGDTVIFVGWDGEVRALLIISDIIRDEAPETVNALRTMNCSVAIVSGDTDITTRSIASQVGIKETLSGTSPVGKRDYIAEMQKENHRVMMVGDGINDAPAITEASVGIAMGRGTEIAIESAGAVLIRNDLCLIPYFIALSRKTYAVLKQNIFWAFFYNIAAIPVAAAGVLHPIIAAGAMAASSLFVVSNSLRIRKQKGNGVIACGP
jgi:Cu2+-exporting ATPase